MAGYYWYQADPALYQAEVQAMQHFFPQFKINQLQDGSGRLYWRGKVQPIPGGIVWDVMLIYKNEHPQAQGYGGSVQILPISPRLKDIANQMMPLLLESYGNMDNLNRKGLQLGLPHVYHSGFGREEEYFICTADPKYFKAGQTSTSAATALSWACKWMMLCEMWMNGEISDDVALEGNY